MSEKHVRILKEARRGIKLCSDDYVCCAIKSAALDLYSVRYMVTPDAYKDLDTSTYEILSLIEESIRPYGLVYNWLSNTHGILLTTQQRREYRLAWIDNMIEYWRDKP